MINSLKSQRVDGARDGMLPTTSCSLPSSSGISSLRLKGRVICWFSCGAASAVATKLAIEKYGTVEIYYTDTGSEHEDNHRFLAECEQWFGQKITTLKSAKYANIWEVFEKQRFLSSPQGAPCTGAMKKEPANGIWNVGDVEIFGYTGEESRRMKRWQRDNPERVIECPLIDKHLTKEDCFGMLARAGIPPHAWKALERDKHPLNLNLVRRLAAIGIPLETILQEP